MNNVNILQVGDKSIDLLNRDIDTIYLCKLEEYMEQTNTTIDELIKFISIEIDMLEKAKRQYIKAYRALPYLDSRTSVLAKLLIDIDKKLTSKTIKLKKYKEKL